MSEIILLELENSLNGSIFGDVYPIYNISRMMKAGCNKFQSVVERLSQAMGEECPINLEAERKKGLNRH